MKGAPLKLKDPEWSVPVLKVVFRKEGRNYKEKMRALIRHYIIVNGEEWAKERITSCYEKYMK